MLSEDQGVEVKKALEGSKGKRKDRARMASGLGTALRTHLHYLRSMLCNALSDLHKYSRLDAGYNDKDRVYKMKVCLCCAHGLLCIGLLAKDMGDVLVSISNLVALQALQEEWKEESNPLSIAEECDISHTISGESAGSKKMAADRPLSGRKMELIERA